MRYNSKKFVYVKFGSMAITLPLNQSWSLSNTKVKVKDSFFRESRAGAGATFDWLFFDNSKLTDFDC